MGSKRSKKSKQEVDLLTEKNNIKKNKHKDDVLEPEINEFVIENNGMVPKAQKRKKKNDGNEEVPKKMKKVNDNEDEVKKIKPKRRKIKSHSIASIENVENETQLQINGETRTEMEEDLQKNIKNDQTDKKREEITWPNEDITELINRMDSNIPEKDILAYRSRVEKLNWDNVAFKNYTAEECKKTWMQVQKRIRRFRLLREILNDAKEWVSTPRTNHKPPRPKRHPDMPRRPLSSYLLFYLKKKDQIISENPGLEGSDITKLVGQIYKNLPPEQREQYEKLAASNKEEYLEKLKIFFENHPEHKPPPKVNHKLEKEKIPKIEKAPKVEKEKIPKIEKEKLPKTEKIPKIEKERPSKLEKEKTPKSERVKPGRSPKADHPLPKERPPKKCQTPFGLYYASELKNMEPGTEKQLFREKCKEQYRQMSDKKKVYWINLAEQDLIRYQEELKTYKEKHPEYEEQKFRPILTKREKVAKDRALGKPVKPPNSAYALYSRSMLQSEDIKSVNPRERMNYIANKWKNCTEEEKNTYRDRVINLMEQYKSDFASYVDSLPEDERNKTIAQTKRRAKASARKSNIMKTPRKHKSLKKESAQPAKLKFTEPEQPPISPCKYFATLYKGDGDPVQAWKSLTSDEKRKYEEELVKKKQAYIVEFEKFLKSLSKEELEAFSKSRQQQVKSDDESSDCSSDSQEEDGKNDDDDDDEDDEEDEDDDVGDDDEDEENGEEEDNDNDVQNNGEDVHEADSD